jgi:hypothetical protein
VYKKRIGSALVGALVVGTAFVPPAFATPSASVSSAFGLAASGLVTIEPLVPLDSSHGFQQKSLATVNLPTEAIKVRAVNSEVGASRAKASVADLQISLTQLVSIADLGALRASVIRSTCVDGVGEASLAAAAIGHIGLDVEPKPNTAISVPGLASVVLNKQTRAADGSLTVTAIWIEVNRIQRIQIASTTCAKSDDDGGGGIIQPPTPIEPGKPPQAPRPTPVPGHHPVTG